MQASLVTNKKCIIFPWITFELNSERYCISTRYISQIVSKPKLTYEKQNIPYRLGILQLRNDFFPVINLKSLLGLPDQRFDYSMISGIKEKHLQWVAALRSSVANNTDFTLATDPHKCTFGTWYDSYTSDNFYINFLLSLIDVPHKNLHNTAVVIEQLKIDGQNDSVRERLDYADRLCKEEIVPLLDELIEVYKTTNREMIILLNCLDQRFGITVDAIHNIEKFNNSSANKEEHGYNEKQNKYLKEIFLSDDNVVHFEIDLEKAVRTVFI